MTLQVTTQSSSSPDVVVLAVSGTPAEELLSLLADGIAELTAAGQMVVLDLDELMMTRASVMRAFLARLLGKSDQDRIVLKCGRLTGRQVLRRWTSDDATIVPSLIHSEEPAVKAQAVPA